MLDVVGWVFLAVVVFLLGWVRIVFPLGLPVLDVVTNLANRVIQGDLPEEISSYDVYAQEKLQMVEDVLNLGRSWHGSYRRVRLVSTLTGTAALIFGFSVVQTRADLTLQPIFVVVGLLCFVAFLFGMVAEERMKRRLNASLTSDLEGLIQLWQRRLSGQEVSA